LTKQVEKQKLEQQAKASLKNQGNSENNQGCRNLNAL